MFWQIQNPSKKENKSKIYCWKTKTNVILKKIRQITLTKTIFFFTPRMIAAGIQNIVMVVGFISY
jgi:hypothetical protein